MPEKEKEGCVKPVAGPIARQGGGTKSDSPQIDSTKEVAMLQAHVGREAPDFEATAYFEGKFKNIKLSDYRGKWILLCFYPGDFTFV